ncbi:DUF1957 domain-containing protein [Anaerobacillus alkaliphilus]|uniref:DUF1957 domain-containing protein n=1 Tax=Anaerobacillus alkaliphilus TaxID=1548597 RepID=A0A4Q0VQV0_9BACI|nr:1,4-alpha-glucan branching protein domain-containing protein [Anaerobacillus alkaliphilus]RXI99447.1 DUF1957 domain-containing protein [Anaerobacillus alkaliphilus]
MINGYFSLVLHAHLPYVRHREAERLEEHWLFEAMTETYIPLIWALEKHQFRKALTISFSTPLMEMLTDSLMQRRFLHYIEKIQLLLEKESNREEQVYEELLLVNFYKDRLKKIKQTFLKYNQNLLQAYRELMEEEKIVCICSSATHAFLPYLQTQEGLKAQVVHGIKTFEKHFGKAPRGFWLPECAFTLGIDRVLFEEGIRYTFVDEQALKNASPGPTICSGKPIYSPNGIMLFPRNQKISNQVWSSIDGYPGDFDYREFYRDVAYDRDWEYIKHFMHSDGIRFDTGLKYHRVTGATEEKDFYHRVNALNKVKEHSDHFIETLKKELLFNEKKGNLPYLIMAPFDAELFGHWWFEGPDWLEEVLVRGTQEQFFFSPEEYVETHFQQIDTGYVSFSTWGRNGYGEVWLNEKNSWIYPKLHRIEKDLIHLISIYKWDGVIVERCLKQMVREWMLATSSDWPFIIDGETATKYAKNRIQEHLHRYEKLREVLVTQKITQELITAYEADYPFLDDIFLELLISRHDQYVISKYRLKESELAKRRVLILAWEYPPLVIGGLARHVYDLSRALSDNGCEVHVVTTTAEDAPEYEVTQGVHIHRVNGLEPHASEFYHWVGGLNIAFMDYVFELAKVIEFDVIHAHDWLVCVAAKAIKEHLEIPIVATIHATEYGRNGGIHTELQQEISHKEWELTYEASKVIVCSNYMKEQVKEVFQLPGEKIEVIPNGVDIEMVKSSKSDWKQCFGTEEDIYIFSIGRMVKEKGFQTIIDAAPLIIENYPNIKFIIAGKGPLLQDYRRQIVEKGLEKNVYFIGFIDDQLRNEMFHGCDICLFPSYYEPFGIVALEGMIAGKPTIVSETGGLSEIVTHEETGLTIYPNNIESLTAQVIRCIEEQELSKKISINGKRLAETNYSWDSISKTTMKVYEACLVRWNKQ